MLDKHLIAKTRPYAEKENIVLWRQYRITVLSDRLFRLERSDNKCFCDKATQTVWFRDMSVQSFSVEENAEDIKIFTKSCTLKVRENRADCRILSDGVWHSIDNSQNLYGTARTLDGYSGDRFVGFFKKGDGNAEESQTITFENGVCSRNGIAVLDDSSSLLLNDSGEVEPTLQGHTDEYIFAFSDDYRSAVKALYMICGSTPAIPRFALGNWWSRYHPYTDKEYLRLLNSFEEEGIPLSVAAVDMDWHYSKNTDEIFHITERGRNTPFHGGAKGWTGYTWNDKLFPDYKSFIKQIEKKNLKLTLNLHPADGIRWWESCYKEMAAAMGVDAQNGEQVKFDISDPKFINNYFSIVHRPYEEDGVSFWWIDWQQGNESVVKGLDPLWALNHYHYLDNAENHKVPLILSRYAGVGSHRYPLGFSGDTYISWETLDFLPYFTATASNVGYTWWSHDIGGHMYGEKDDEMFLRHVQYGVFSPVNRLHCTNARVCTKEPWAYGNGAGELAKKWLRLRHRLIPYLYTCAHTTSADGIALIEPLYYRWKSPNAYQYKNEYFFGSQLLVAPVATRLEADGFSRTRLWIEKGKWTDIFTGAQYDAGECGREFTALRQLESIPVLIRSGGILPLSDETGSFYGNPRVMEIRVWSGDGSYSLYEDKADENIEGSAVTEFEALYQEKNGEALQTLKIKAFGDKNIIPENRIFKVRFSDIKEGSLKLFVDGTETQADEVLTDCAAVDFNAEIGKSYRIEVKFTPKTKLDRLKDFAFKTLICANDNLKSRNDLLKQILAVKDKEEYKSVILKTDTVKEIVKECLLEIF